ncbi:hypothetical protein C0Z17_02775 [Trinickia caryophylli]|nr:hypothetical protein C0Z17_02775 [Trinickia caryophylli]
MASIGAYRNARQKRCARLAPVHSQRPAVAAENADQFRAAINAEADGRPRVGYAQELPVEELGRPFGQHGRVGILRGPYSVHEAADLLAVVERVDANFRRQSHHASSR